MIKKNLKDNANNLSEQELQIFADRTEGYSGSDIANLIKDAVFQPVRKLQAARKFRRVGGKLVIADDNAVGPDIVETSLANIPREQLDIPVITAGDLQLAMTKTKPSVDHSQLKEYEQFTKNFGQDG